MEIYHEWDYRPTRHILWWSLFGREGSCEFRLRPLCPHCDGRGGWLGSEVEPSEECSVCNGEGVLNPATWLRYQLWRRFWDSRLGEWASDFNWWREAPTRDYTDMLYHERWREPYPEQ